MKMTWRKLGIIFKPDKSRSWAQTHAMVPTPLLLRDIGVLRVFYTACDAAGIGRPAFVDLDPDDPSKVLGESEQPLMEIGRPGTFDENGVLPTCVVSLPDGRLYMYYVGFEIGTKIRYRLLTGVAVSSDLGVTFQRCSPVPALERSSDELYFRGGPFVLYEDGRFRMWYVAGSEWIDLGGKSMPEYRVKYLESLNGLDWGPSGQLVLDISEPDEHGFGRPWVIRDGDCYQLYYSVRRKSLSAYRMGYAESQNGTKWTRHDEWMNLDVGPDAYDDTAIMYAAPISIGGRTYCFYNGNDFGRDGIALAVREDA